MFIDRLNWVAAFVVLIFAGVLLFDSQSAASIASYLLTILMLVTWRDWIDVVQCDLFYFLLVFICYLLLSCFWSTGYDARDVFSFAVRSLLTLIFVVAVAEGQARGVAQRALNSMLCVVGSLAAIVAFTVFLNDPPADGRLQGLGQLDNNVTAGFIFGVSTLFAARHFVEGKSWTNKALGAISVLVLSAAVIATDSRAAIGALAVGMVAYTSAVSNDTFSRFLIVFLSIAVVGVTMLVVLTFGGFEETILPRGDSHRLAIWSHVVERVTNGHTGFGLGVLTDDAIHHAGLTFMHPHSIYLSLFFQGGATALVLFLLLNVRLFTVLRTKFESADAKFALALLAMALSAYVFDEHELIDKVGSNWFLFWFAVGLTLGLQWASQPPAEDL